MLESSIEIFTRIINPPLNQQFNTNTFSMREISKKSKGCGSLINKSVHFITSTCVHSGVINFTQALWNPSAFILTFYTIIYERVVHKLHNLTSQPSAPKSFKGQA